MSYRGVIEKLLSLVMATLLVFSNFVPVNAASDEITVNYKYVYGPNDDTVKTYKVTKTSNESDKRIQNFQKNIVDGKILIGYSHSRNGNVSYHTFQAISNNWIDTHGPEVTLYGVWRDVVSKDTSATQDFRTVVMIGDSYSNRYWLPDQQGTSFYTKVDGTTNREILINDRNNQYDQWLGAWMNQTKHRLGINNLIADHLGGTGFVAYDGNGSGNNSWETMIESKTANSDVTWVVFAGGWNDAQYSNLKYKERTNAANNNGAALSQNNYNQLVQTGISTVNKAKEKFPNAQVAIGCYGYGKTYSTTDPMYEFKSTSNGQVVNGRATRNDYITGTNARMSNSSTGVCKAYMEIAEKTNSLYITDSENVLKSHINEDIFFADGNHPNFNGEKYIAEHISNFLRDNTITVTFYRNSSPSDKQSVSRTFTSFKTPMQKFSDNNWSNSVTGKTMNDRYTVNKDGSGGSYSVTSNVSRRWVQANQPKFTLYAQWTPHKYTVSFDKNTADSGTMSDIEVAYDESRKLPANLYTKRGYSFVGWNTKTNGTGTAFSDTQTIKNLSSTDGDKITLFAQWQINNYKIDYELGGGSPSGNNPTSYNVNTDTFTLKNPIKRGYDFTGWTQNNSTTLQTTVTIQKGSVGDKKFTANYKPIVYTITYNLNGGSNSSNNPSSYTIESDPFTLSPATKEGYNFIGWSDGNTTSLSPTIDPNLTENRVFTAIFEKVAEVLTPEEECSSSGGYFYNNTCNPVPEPTPQEKCAMDNKFWYNDTCNEEPLKTDEEICEEQGGNFEDGVCKFEPICELSREQIDLINCYSQDSVDSYSNSGVRNFIVNLSYRQKLVGWKVNGVLISDLNTDDVTILNDGQVLSLELNCYKVTSVEAVIEEIPLSDEEICLNENKYWYDEACHLEPKEEEEIEDLTPEEECEKSGGYFNNGTCYVSFENYCEITNDCNSDPIDNPGSDPVDPPVVDPTDPPEDDPTNPPGDDPTDPPGDDPTDPPGNDPTNPPTDDPANPGENNDDPDPKPGDNPDPKDPEEPQEDSIEEKCELSGKYWYDGKCNDEPYESKDNDSDDPVNPKPQDKPGDNGNQNQNDNKPSVDKENDSNNSSNKNDQVIKNQNKLNDQGITQRQTVNTGFDISIGYVIILTVSIPLLILLLKKKKDVKLQNRI